MTSNLRALVASALLLLLSARVQSGPLAQPQATMLLHGVPSITTEKSPRADLASVVDPDGDGLVGRVNLNTGSLDELQMLPGLGPRRAAKLIALRRRRPLTHIRHVMRIKGVGRTMYRRWRDHLKVRGASTLRKVPRR